jgi:hypothetical protein
MDVRENQRMLAYVSEYIEMELETELDFVI